MDSASKPSIGMRRTASQLESDGENAQGATETKDTGPRLHKIARYVSELLTEESSGSEFLVRCSTQGDPVGTGTVSVRVAEDSDPPKLAPNQDNTAAEPKEKHALNLAAASAVLLAAASLITFPGAKLAAADGSTIQQSPQVGADGTLP